MFKRVLWMVVMIGATLYATEDREAIKQEILKSLEAVDQARHEMMRELMQTVATIEAERAAVRGDSLSGSSSETTIVEAKAVGDIAVSTAKVELSKVEASKRIHQAIDKVSKVTGEEALEDAKAKAVQTISDAISLVEITKVGALKEMIQATGKVEQSKLRQGKTLIDDASAITVAKNVSAVKIARAVSAVEIAKAVASVELGQMLPDEKLAALLGVNYKHIPMAQLEVKAAAAISTAVSRVEVERAKALADIAHIVAFVEMAKGLKNSKRVPPSSYSREFLRYKVD